MILACKMFVWTSLIVLAAKFGWLAFKDWRQPDAHGMVPSANVFLFLQLSMMMAAFSFLMRKLS